MLSNFAETVKEFFMPLGTRLNMCTVCNVTMKRDKKGYLNLYQHYINEHRIECPECGVCSLSKDNLLKHIQALHK